MTPQRDDGPAPTPRVMVLSVWATAGAAWHARLVAADACVHEFDSPFELARFLALAHAAPLREAGGGGLR